MDKKRARHEVPNKDLVLEEVTDNMDMDIH